jgi:hypothetical protein
MSPTWRKGTGRSSSCAQCLEARFCRMRSSMIRNQVPDGPQPFAVFELELNAVMILDGRDQNDLGDRIEPQAFHEGRVEVHLFDLFLGKLKLLPGDVFQKVEDGLLSSTF